MNKAKIFIFFYLCVILSTELMMMPIESLSTPFIVLEESAKKGAQFYFIPIFDKFIKVRLDDNCMTRVIMA